MLLHKALGLDQCEERTDVLHYPHCSEIKQNYTFGFQFGFSNRFSGLRSEAAAPLHVTYVLVISLIANLLRELAPVE